jgi:hypothetical protein
VARGAEHSDGVCTAVPCRLVGRLIGDRTGRLDRHTDSRAARIVFSDSRGTEVLWVGVCAPHGWNLTEISVRSVGFETPSVEVTKAINVGN